LFNFHKNYRSFWNQRKSRIQESETVPKFTKQKKSSASVIFEKGLQNHFSQKSDFFNPKKWTPKEMEANAEQNYYPIAIQLIPTLENVDSDREDVSLLKSTTSNSSQNFISKSPWVSDEGKTVTCQTTYCSLIPLSTGDYEIKAIKQSIQYDKKPFKIFEIYGLEGSDNESKRDCVICISEKCTEIVLPCRHMCLCRSCAVELRSQSNKCPVCRRNFCDMVGLEFEKEKEKEIEV